MCAARVLALERWTPDAVAETYQAMMQSLQEPMHALPSLVGVLVAAAVTTSGFAQREQVCRHCKSRHD